MEKKGHRGINHGRFPVAIQDKARHPDSLLGKLRGLGPVVMIPLLGVHSLPADHLPRQIALLRLGCCPLVIIIIVVVAKCKVLIMN